MIERLQTLADRRSELLARGPKPGMRHLWERQLTFIKDEIDGILDELNLKRKPKDV